MKPLVTIYIPYAPYHSEIRINAIHSAERQTIKCKVLSALSLGSPAHFRNAAKFADTDFVVMLDADDTLQPSFVEECLKTYQEGRYVYTSWVCGDYLMKPNLCVTRDTDYRSHLVTTLYPTAIFKALGGFNTTLSGHEDVDFYLRSARAGVCGVHLDKPLVNYSEHGQRSELFAKSPDKKRIMDEVFLSNGGQSTIMACCGQPGTQTQIVIGEALPGDVMAETLWAGMHTEVGYVTQRVYRGGNGSQVPVAPADLEQMGHLFRKVQTLSDLAPKKDQVLKEAGLI
jgi:hypothetical protein